MVKKAWALMTPVAIALALTSCTSSPTTKSTEPMKSVDVATVSPQQLSGFPRDSTSGTLLLDVSDRGSHSEQPIVTTTGHVQIWLNCPGTDRAIVSVGLSSTTIACSTNRDDKYFIGFDDLPRTKLPVVVDTGGKTPWRLQLVETSA